MGTFEALVPSLADDDDVASPEEAGASTAQACAMDRASNDPMRRSDGDASSWSTTGRGPG